MNKVEIVTGVTGPEKPAAETAEAVTTPAEQTEQIEQVDQTDQVDQPEQTDDAEEKSLTKYSEEFFAKGELSELSFTELEEMGYPRNVVEQFIAGQKALIANEEQAVFASVGGKQNYDQMIQWAGESLSQQEIEAYNKAVASGDQAQIMFAVKGLQARYAAQTREPNFVSSGGKAAPSVYRSVAEVVQAMSDPRYKVDPAYRADVERKIAASNVL
jgi:uncharacterized membrane protein